MQEKYVFWIVFFLVQSRIRMRRSLHDVDVVNIKAVAPEKQFKFDACVASIYNIERISYSQERKDTHVDCR